MWRQEHFASEHGGCASETEGMRALRELGRRLGQDGAVHSLLAALQDSEGISTFEFLSSGAVKQLKAYLQGGALALVTIVLTCREPALMLRVQRRVRGWRRVLLSDANASWGTVLNTQAHMKVARRSEHICQSEACPHVQLRTMRSSHAMPGQRIRATLDGCVAALQGMTWRTMRTGSCCCAACTRLRRRR